MAKIELGFKTLPRVTVATAGVPVPLSAVPFFVLQCTVQFDGSNTGDAYIGESDVTPTKCLVLNGSTPVLSFEAEDTAADEDNVGIDLNKVYVDGSVNGTSVFVAYTAITSVSYNG